MSMKTVGFIDYYLDEWHANNYPQMISEQSGGRYQVQYAWAKIDSPKPGGRTNIQWAQEMGIELCATMEEVIEKSDVLVVLSPDNPEQHEELCHLPLQSGKRVYVDKTFADTAQVAKRILDHAHAHNTPFFTSSALRFADEYKGLGQGISAISSWGPGTYEVYSIHQIEPIVAMLGTDIERVMYIGNDHLPSLLMEFSGNRKATLANFIGSENFMMQLCFTDHAPKTIQVDSPFFKNFIDSLISFYDTGHIPAPNEQTLAVIAIREAGFAAAKKPGEWVPVTI